jgi:23S rRNA pseudouridine1911/1915/1917 synthase
MSQDQLFRVPPELAQQTLAAALRRWLPGKSWSQVGKLIAGRRVSVSGNLCLDPARRLKADEVVKLLKSAATAPPREEQICIRHVDAHVVVVEKPAGMTTIRHPEEKDWPARRKQLQPTLDELLPRLLAKPLPRPLPGAGRGARKRSAPPSLAGKGAGGLGRIRPVHRLDRETSGLMVFARTVDAERHLGMQFRKHTVHRRYLAIVHGRIAAPRTLDTHLVRDRGDGRRGSTTLPNVGKRAITHIKPLEDLGEYTLIECRIETGRTHQIRIHLAEAGHMLCGEKVYHQPLGGTGCRPSASRRTGMESQGRQPVPHATAPRIMLHAAELGFEHPVTGKKHLFHAAPPEDFQEFLAKLRRK